MDNQSLNAVLSSNRERQFWFKPIGLPGQPLHDHPETWPEDPVDITFTNRPRVEVGDVLIAYRTGAVRLIYVAECLEPAREFTDEEMRENHWRNRFPWHFNARNLTPEFGRVCINYRLNPYAMARAFNLEHSETPVTLGAINFGSSVLGIPRPFAEVLLLSIRNLDNSDDEK